MSCCNTTCKKSTKCSKSTMRVAQNIMNLRPSGLDGCIKCECGPCGTGCKVKIEADETTITGDVIIEGELSGNVTGEICGVFTGDVCLGKLLSSIQLICSVPVGMQYDVTACDHITQIRLQSGDANPAQGILENGMEGQHKIIHLYAPDASYSTNIISTNLNGGTAIMMTGPEASVQMYFAGGSWYPYAYNNAVIV